MFIPYAMNVPNIEEQRDVRKSVLRPPGVAVLHSVALVVATGEWYT
jgi:hypothetical protein